MGRIGKKKRKPTCPAPTFDTVNHHWVFLFGDVRMSVDTGS